MRLPSLQHYGPAPTNLMDFSTDWRVALYFACEKKEEKDGRIIYLTEKEAQEAYNLRLRCPQGHQHDQSGRAVGREIEQASVLALSDTGEFTPCSEHIEPVCHELKAGLLAWLRAQGIHRESVYRDTHGFVSLAGDDRSWPAIHVAECAIVARRPDVAKNVLLKADLEKECPIIEQKGKAYFLLGRAFESLGKYGDALRAYKKACRRLLHIENGIAPLLGVYRCCNNLGKTDEADRALRNIGSLWPSAAWPAEPPAPTD